ncbi:DUF2382 domain-containing protein [Novosphingobium sp. RD2P27]|uniref:DUF2382 domain-containing protein n=1 Tax=Novosphingobium kalidii TaxID=3230299 RepID=A0ABV2D405_9SPHN
MTDNHEHDSGVGPESAPGDRIRIPIVEERIHLEKQKVETGRVRVTSRVVSETQPVHETLATVRVQVERVPVDRVVTEAPPVRTEGNRTIIPVTEEVLVKCIRVTEEIHLVEERTESPFENEVTLRRTEVDVARD